MAFLPHAQLLLTTALFALAGCNEAKSRPELEIAFQVAPDQVPQFKIELSRFAATHSLKYIDDSKAVAGRRKAVGIDDIADYAKNSLSYDENLTVSSRIDLPATQIFQPDAYIVAHNGGLPGGFVSIYARFDKSHLSQSRLVSEFQKSISAKWEQVPKP